MKYSILLGSGFSFPGGLPSVAYINNRIKTIKPEELESPDSRKQIFDGIDPFDELQERIPGLFFTEFIENYCQENDDFNYETFYDYFTSEDEKINSFCETFKNKYKFTQDNKVLMMTFDAYYQHLVASELKNNKFLKNTTVTGKYNRYTEFVSLLTNIIKDENTIDIHTLNHDLLLEHICTSTELDIDFGDGFSELGSPFYSKITKEEGSIQYTTRLRQFTNEYPKQISLYKLHGSIDMYTFYQDSSVQGEKVKIKLETYIFKEIKNTKTGKSEYTRPKYFENPDFLTGSTSKILKYGGPHYKKLFDHFKTNLKLSEVLIIIGYGFGDKGINDILKKYAIDRGIIPIVIDPYKSEHPFYKENNFNPIRKSIEDVKAKEISNLIKDKN